ncbi:hypothetical protein CEE44_04375 [Candidatus Woesearchaeota archaeon B3_Woes]|nr:MAG: hypothetical protein CEE44_04375 [Candidatus Woesearchaeota archaeon B3_Woes]
MDQQIYNKDISKEFFKSLANAYHKYEKTDKAKERLNKHVEKVKELSLNKKTPKKKITQEFKRLEKLILEVISLERGILARGDEKDISQEVKDRIIELEEKFEKYTKMIEGRQQKVKELEKKIKTKMKEDKAKGIVDPVTNTKNIELKNILYDLEEKYEKLKSRGIPKSKLKVIEDKINRLKEKI